MTAISKEKQAGISLGYIAAFSALLLLAVKTSIVFVSAGSESTAMASAQGAQLVHQGARIREAVHLAVEAANVAAYSGRVGCAPNIFRMQTGGEAMRGGSIAVVPNYFGYQDDTCGMPITGVPLQGPLGADGKPIEWLFGIYAAGTDEQVLIGWTSTNLSKATCQRINELTTGGVIEAYATDSLPDAVSPHPHALANLGITPAGRQGYCYQRTGGAKPGYRYILRLYDKKGIA